MNPFTENQPESAGALGESGLIEAIRSWLGPASPPAPEGIGDDCAVFSPTPGARALVTTDPIVWGRHFDQDVAPEAASAKLFKRNLSDIAAMGGRPRVAVVSLLLPASTSLEWLQRFHAGLRDVSIACATPLAGGDVSQTDGLLAACLTLVGETTGERALTRSGARPGDRLFVTGSLGGSLLGRHLSFEPRLAEGQWLAARPEVTAGIDLSDGLAKDLPALLPPGCEAELFADAIPLNPDADRMARESGRPPLFHALCDGEDYELLVAAAPGATAWLDEWRRDFALPLTEIGFIRERGPEAGEILLCGLPPGVAGALHGYEHLR
jgi:thiamine-monophosphate kinase